MITLRTALGGVVVTASSLGRPMLRPAPVMPELPPTPMIVLFEPTSYMPPGSRIVPFTRMTNGSTRKRKLSRPSWLLTVTVCPSDPPVVPPWPRPATEAQPTGGSVACGGGEEAEDVTVIGTVSDAANCVSEQLSPSTYAPVESNLAVAPSVDAFGWKVTEPGPLTLDQVQADGAAGLGRPSSVTSPASGAPCASATA